VTTYDPNVPEQANFVRGASGDLVEMRDNFRHLAPLASGAIVSGEWPASELVGFTLRDGTETGTDVFRVVVFGTDHLEVQRVFGGNWFPVVRFPLVSGADIRLENLASGQTPLSGYHLATKGYVDARVLDNLADVSVAGATSGQALGFSGGVWVPINVAPLLSALGDVALFSPASGDLLQFNGSQWTNVSGISGGGGGTLDHGGLSGLADDDHPQYSRADGTRPFTGTVSGVTPTQPAHLTTRSYVDGAILALSGLTISGAVTLSGLIDVDDGVDLEPDGYLLTLSGGNWFARPPPQGADIIQIQVFS